MPDVKKFIKQGLLRVGVFPAISKLQSRQIVILRYHSVLHEPAEHADSIGWGIIHSSSVFDQEMEYVARTCNPVTMDEVLDFARGASDIPRRSIAVTFDDGFEDNLSVAVPILNRYGVPGIVYVATDYVAAIPWYCSLRYIFAKTLRHSFVDPFCGATRDLSTQKSRYESFLACSRVCAGTPRAKIHTAITALEQQLEVQYRPARPIMLTWDGTREILQKGHAIGSHSLSHPNMAYISKEELLDQMTASRDILEEQTGNKIHHFSYPSPIMEPHWTESTVDMCRSAGYGTAVTCTNGVVRRTDRSLSLKRIFAPRTLLDFTWALENAFAGRMV